MNTQIRIMTGALLTLAACSAATTEVTPSELGTTSTQAALRSAIASTGPIIFEKHTAAHWSVPLSGLLNLDHPKSEAAGLEDGDEPIDIYVYTLVHPEYGTFLVDSGVAESFADSSMDNEVSSIVESAMNIPALDILQTTRQLQLQLGKIDGVFLTHIHLDHIMGLPDLENTAVYGGPGDAELTTFMNIFTQGTTSRMLKNVESIREWQFDNEGVVDVFGDGSLWAIHAPGHTPGATAYLANTTEGPQLMIGDVTHTSWGWENGVEPGTYSHDIDMSKTSLNLMQEIASVRSNIDIHPGHQSLSQ